MWRGLIRERSGWSHIQFIKCLGKEYFKHMLRIYSSQQAGHQLRMRAVWCLIVFMVGFFDEVGEGSVTDLLGPVWIPPAVAWIGFGSAGDFFCQWSGSCVYGLHWLWRTPPWKAASPEHRPVLQGPPPWCWWTALFQKTKCLKLILSLPKWLCWLAEVAQITLCFRGYFDD